MSVPLELAALRGLLAHGCSSCFWTGERGPGEDRVLASGAGASRQRSSQQAPEGAVFLGGTGGWKGSKWTRIFSPQTAVVYYTQEKNHKLKNANKRSRGGHCAGSRLCPVDLRAGCGSGAPGSPLQTLTRLQQLLLGSFSLLYFSLIRQVFFFFFFLS